MFKCTACQRGFATIRGLDNHRDSKTSSCRKSLWPDAPMLRRDDGQFPALNSPAAMDQSSSAPPSEDERDDTRHAAKVARVDSDEGGLQNSPAAGQGLGWDAGAEYDSPSETRSELKTGGSDTGSSSSSSAAADGADAEFKFGCLPNESALMLASYVKCNGLSQAQGDKLIGMLKNPNFIVQEALQIGSVSKLNKTIRKTIAYPMERKTLRSKDGLTEMVMDCRDNWIDVIAFNVIHERFLYGPIDEPTKHLQVSPSPPVSPSGAALATLQQGLFFHTKFEEIQGKFGAADATPVGLICGIIELDKASTSLFCDATVQVHPVYVVCANIHPDFRNHVHNRELVAFLPIFNERVVSRERKLQNLPKLSKKNMKLLQQEFYLLAVNELFRPLLTLEGTRRDITMLKSDGSVGVVRCYFTLSSITADLVEMWSLCSVMATWCPQCKTYEDQFRIPTHPHRMPHKHADMMIAINNNSAFKDATSVLAPSKPAPPPLASMSGPETDTMGEMRTPQDTMECVRHARSLMNALAYTPAAKRENRKAAESFLKAFGIHQILLHVDNLILLCEGVNIFDLAVNELMHGVVKGPFVTSIALISSAMASSGDREADSSVARFDASIDPSIKRLTNDAFNQRLHDTIDHDCPASANLRILGAGPFGTTKTLQAHTYRSCFRIMRCSIYDADIRVVRLLCSQVKLWRLLQQQRDQTVAQLFKEIPEQIFEVQLAFHAFVADSLCQLNFPKLHRLVHLPRAAQLFAGLQAQNGEFMEANHKHSKEAVMLTNLNVGFEQHAAGNILIQKEVKNIDLNHARDVEKEKLRQEKAQAQAVDNMVPLPGAVAGGGGVACAAAAPQFADSAGSAPHTDGTDWGELGSAATAFVCTPLCMKSQAGLDQATLLCLLATPVDKCEIRLGNVASPICAQNLLVCPEFQNSTDWPVNTSGDVVADARSDKLALLRNKLRRYVRGPFVTDDDWELAQRDFNKCTLVALIKKSVRAMLEGKDWVNKAALNLFLQNEYKFLTSILVYSKCKCLVQDRPSEFRFYAPANPADDDNTAGFQPPVLGQDGTDIQVDGGKSFVQFVAQHDYKRRSRSTARDGIIRPRMDCVRLTNTAFDEDSPMSATNPPAFICQLMQFFAIPAEFLQHNLAINKQKPRENLIFFLGGAFKEMEAPPAWQIPEEGQLESRASMLPPMMYARDFGQRNGERFRYRVNPINAITAPAMVCKTTFLVPTPGSAHQTSMYFLNIDATVN